MYHHTIVVMIGEDERLEVDVVPDQTGVAIRAQSDLTLRIDWDQARELVDELVSVIPPRPEPGAPRPHAVLVTGRRVRSR